MPQLRENQGKTIPKEYLFFLIIGSALRLGMEVYAASNLKSWHMFSIVLSEISSGIFYAVYFPIVKKNTRLPLWLLAFALIPLLNHLELRSEFTSTVINENKTVILRDSFSMGCQGSDVQLDFPLQQKFKLLNSVAITDCGFTEKIFSPTNDFVIGNTTSQVLNLRLYKLQVLYGRVKWKFLRLVQVKSSEVWAPQKLIAADTMYLVKMPENRKLGHLTIMPSDFQKFPIGNGKLLLDYDSLNWISQP